MQQSLIATTPTVPSIAKPELYQPPVDIFSSVANIKYNPSSAPTTFNAEVLKRYPSFNPFEDNEQNYAQNQGTLSRAWNSIYKFAGYTGSTFLEGFASIPDQVKGFKGENVYKNEWSQALDDWRANLENTHPNYQNNWEKQHPFLNAIDPFHGNPMNFWGDNLLKNAGFTIGAIGNAMVTDAVVGAVTGGIGEMPLLANQVGKAALWLNKALSAETKAGQMLREISPVQKMFDAVKEMGVHPDAIKTMANWKAAADMSKLSTAARYGINLYTASHTEAAIEARDGYNKIRQDLIQKYKDENWKEPDVATLAEIDKTATTAANYRYGFNMGVLLISNMIQWESMLKPFKSLTNKVSEQGEKALIQDAIETTTTKGKWGNIFDKAIKPAIPSILSEGVFEEGGQYAIENGVANYFKNQYDPKHKEKLNDIISSVMHSYLHDTLGSDEGRMNVLVGALMGGISHHIEAKHTSINEKKAGILSPEESARVASERLKDFSLTGAFENQYEGAAKNIKRQEDLKKAVDNNDVFAYKNLKSGAFFDYIMSSIQANRFDVRMEELKQAKELPEEELRKVLVDDTADRQSAAAYLDKLINKAQEIKQIHDGVSSMLKNPYTYRGGAIGDIEKDAKRQQENENFMAFEKYKAALTNLTFNTKDYQSRTSDIALSLANINPDFSTDLVMELTHPDTLQSLKKEYGKEAEDLQKQLDNEEIIGKEHKQKIKKLLELENKIEEFFKSPSPEAEKTNLLALFPQLATFEANNRSVDIMHSFPIEKASEVINYGVDLNRLDHAKNLASQMYNYLMTKEGIETFMKEHEDWSNSMHLGWKPTTIEENPEDFEYNGKTFSIGKTYTGLDGSTFTILDEPFNNKIKVKIGDGIDFIDVTVLSSATVVKTKEEIEQERIEALNKDKKIRENVQKTLNILTNNDPEIQVVREPPIEEEKEGIGFKKPISIIAQTTTEQRWRPTTKQGEPLPISEEELEMRKVYGLAHERHQTFLFNLSQNKTLQKQHAEGKIKIIPITAKTASAFGLENIIPKGTDAVTEKPYKDVLIRYVYIYDNGDGTFNYIDQNGDKTEGADLKTIIFTNAPNEDLSFTKKNTGERFPSYYNNLTEDKEVPKEIADQVLLDWKERRNDWLSANFTPEQATSLAFTFKVSRGLKNVQNTSAKTNILDTTLIKEEDLLSLYNGHPVVQAATFGTVNLEALDGRINIPFGHPYFDFNDNIFELYSRNLTPKEAEISANLLIKLADDLVNGREYSPIILNYLRGVVGFKNKPGQNAVYFDKEFNLHIGDKSIPIVSLSEYKGEIEQTLEGVYHHVDSQLLNNFKKDQNTRFNELDEEGNVVKEWANYQQYLLGKRNGIAPLTTNIVIPQDGELPLIQKYAILDIAAPDIIIPPKKEIKKTKKTVEKQNKTENENIIINDDGVIEEDEDEFFTSLMTVTETPVLTPITNKQTGEEDFTSAMKAVAAKMGFFDNVSDEFVENGNFRLINHPITLQGNTKEETEEVKRMLPNVKIEHLENLINTTGGLKAWGEALPHFIYVYEGAPYGARYHEAFEQVFNYILSPKNQLDLVKEFNQRQGTFVTYKGETKKYSEASFYEAKEQIADEFAEYKATGTVPFPKPKTSGFFKSLWEFIKTLFTNKQTIENVFSKLNKGEYANSPIMTPIKKEHHYKIANMPVKTVQDMVAGMTAYAFAHIAKDDEAINALVEENQEFATKDVMKNVYQELDSFYYGIDASSLKAYYKSLAGNDEHLKEQYFKEYLEIVATWDNIKSQWGSFTSELALFFKTLGIEMKVNDQGEYDFTEEDLNDDENSKGEEGRTSYTTEDRTFANVKNNASTNVKILFATIAESEFFYSIIKNALVYAPNSIPFNKVNRQTNTMRLPILANYAKLFNYVLHNSANINGIVNIEKKLTRIVKETEERFFNELNLTKFTKEQTAQRKHIAANLDKLVKRLSFNGTFKGKTSAQVKRILQVEGTLSKQKPSITKNFITRDGKSVNISSNISDRASQLTEEWLINIRTSKFVKTVRKQTIFLPKLDGKTLFDNNNFVFLSNLNIPFTASQYNTLPKHVRKPFKDAVEALKDGLSKFTKIPLPEEFTKSSSEIGERLEDLALIYSQYFEGDTTESQRLNLDGKPISNFALNNFLSYIINDINGSHTLESFKKLNPQYDDLYMGSGWLLNNVLFKNGDRTQESISVNITEGRQHQIGNNVSITKMSLGERILNDVNNNLNNQWNIVVGADAKTEWGYTCKSILNKSYFLGNKESQLSDFINEMYKSLQNEIDLCKDFIQNGSNVEQLNKTHADNRTVGASLRFFRGMLSKETVDNIHHSIDNNEVWENKEVFTKELLSYIEERALDTYMNLEGWELIQKGRRKNEKRIYGLDHNFLSFITNNPNIGVNPSLTEEKIKDILFYREANYVFMGIETHKLLINDPAQYKDELKRVKSFESGREYTHSSENSDLNEWLDETLNRVGEHKIQPFEYGYKAHKNSFNGVTLKDVETTSDEIEMLQAVLKEKVKPYTKGNIADAQSWMLGITYREALYKSAGNLSKDQQNLIEWLMAYERQSLLSKGTLTEDKYSKGLQQADKKLVEEGIPYDKKGHPITLQILKPIISGVRIENEKAVQYLYKTSTAPLFLYFVENTPMENVYLQMMEKSVDFLAMESAHKVGQTTDNTTSLYNGTEINEHPFDNINTIQIDYKYFGKQVETGGDGHGQTQGSQMTDIVVGNLMNEGKAINEQAQQDVDRHTNALRDLALARSERLFNKLGIKKGEFGYTIEDKTLVSDFLLSEIFRRELPRNIAEGLQVNENGQFIHPLEFNNNFKKIKEILYSTIKNNLTKPTMSGGQGILLSALGYDNLVKKTVNGKEVLTSNKLKFYRKGEDGKTLVCQIAIPYIFGRKVLKTLEEKNGTKFANEKEGHAAVLKYLNKTEDGRALLKGIGFRIPTQALNSIDAFEIAEFLPPQMGHCVIFPAEITAKAGSDFDVDKMNMYLRNWFLDAKTGMPKLVPFFGTGEEAKKQIEHFVDGLDNKEDIIDFLENSADRYIGDIDSLEKELDKIEKFKSLLYLQSLENRYYDSIENILTAEYSYKDLITPNDASDMEKVSETIVNKREHGDKKYEKLEASRLLDSLFIANERQKFLNSKSDVGIAAVANRALIKNQMTGAKRKILNYGRNFAVRFPFNHDGNLANVGALYNVKGQSLLNLNSQIIDGTVDTVNKPWLPALLNRRGLLPVTLLMITNLGIAPEIVASYINQPAIQEFLKRVEINNNISPLLNRKKLTKPEIFGEVMTKLGYDKYQVKKEVNDTKPSIYKIESLHNTVGKSFKELTEEEKLLQLQYLSDFIGYEKLANAQFTATQGSNYDTANYISPEIINLKKLQTQQAYKQEELINFGDVFNKTSIGVLREAILNTHEGLNGLFATSKGHIEETLNQVDVDLKTQHLNGENFVKYKQMATMSLIDFIVQNNVNQQGSTLSKLIDSLLFNKEINIAKWWNVLRTHPSFINNPIVQNIIGVDENKDGWHSYLKLVEKDYDAHTTNLWEDAFRELSMNGEILTLGNQRLFVSDLYNNVVISQILQNGRNRNRNSFFHLLPNDVVNNILSYSSLVSDILENLNDFDVFIWMNEGMFYRNNWYDNKLVPETIKTKKVLDGDGEVVSMLPMDGLSNRDVFWKQLAEAGYEQQHFITNTFFQYNKPFIKHTVYDSYNKLSKVVLYKRVEIVNENGSISPVLVNLGNGTKQKWFAIFKPVNKLGNTNLQEYNENSLYSHLAINEKVKEIPDNVIINALSASGMQIKFHELTQLVSSNNFDEENFDEDDEFVNNYIADNEENNLSLPKEAMQGNLFQETPSTQGVNQIYSQLGNKTASNNVRIESWNQLKDVKEPFLKVYDIIAQIVSTRIKNTNEHFGNPFSHDPAGKTQGLIKTETIKEAVEKYIDWILGKNLDTDDLFKRLTKVGDITTLTFNEEGNDIKVKILEINDLAEDKTKVKVLNLKTNKEYTYIINSNGTSDKVDIDFKYGNNPQLEQRRQWIRGQLQSGELKNKPILYYKELGEPSHATALDYLINKYDWNNETVDKNQLQKQNIFTVKPIQTADKKAIIKASVANKFIGFAEGIAGSSTAEYARQINEQSNKKISSSEVSNLIKQGEIVYLDENKKPCKNWTK